MRKWFVIIIGAVLSLPLSAQSQKQRKSQMRDSVALENVTVIGKSKTQKLREGALSVNAIDVHSMIGSLSNLTDGNPLIVIDGNIRNVDMSNFDLAAQCKIYNHAVTISRLPSATREEVAAFAEIWKEQMSYKKTDEIGLGFMAPPGTTFPESFNEEAGIDAVLSEYLDSGKDPSEFFSDKEYPNCCQNNCDNCNSLGGCCLLAVGKKMKGIQEKQKTFGTIRTTFIINEEGIIEQIFAGKQVKTKEHAEQILKK